MSAAAGLSLFVEGTDSPICNECAGEDVDGQILAQVIQMVDTGSVISEMIRAGAGELPY